MLSCRDLDGFVDKLCDLTRDMPNLARAREAAELLDLIEQVPQRFLMQWRAAAVADEHYLNGESIREIAKEVGKSFQGVSAWLRDHGPTHYLSLVNEAGVIRAIPFTVDGENTKVKIRQFWSAGRVIVPAVENAIDPGTGEVRAGIDLQDLWQRHGPSAS